MYFRYILKKKNSNSQRTEQEARLDDELEQELQGVHGVGEFLGLPPVLDSARLVAGGGLHVVLEHDQQFVVRQGGRVVLVDIHLVIIK